AETDQRNGVTLLQRLLDDFDESLHGLGAVDLAHAGGIGYSGYEISFVHLCLPNLKSATATRWNFLRSRCLQFASFKDLPRYPVIAWTGWSPGSRRRLYTSPPHPAQHQAWRGLQRIRNTRANTRRPGVGS